jgi:hypothetical protein
VLRPSQKEKAQYPFQCRAMNQPISCHKAADFFAQSFPLIHEVTHGWACPCAFYLSIEKNYNESEFKLMQDLNLRPSDACPQERYLRSWLTCFDSTWAFL